MRRTGNTCLLSWEGIFGGFGGEGRNVKVLENLRGEFLSFAVNFGSERVEPSRAHLSSFLLAFTRGLRYALV